MVGAALSAFLAVSALAAGSADALPARRTIFLNKTNGTYFNGQNNDSVVNVSSLLSNWMTAQVTVPAAPLTDDEWNQVVQCVQTAYAPFSSVITDVDPSPGRHIEVVIGGTPELVGALPVLNGDSPNPSCAAGAPIEGAITFVFAEKLKTDFPADYVQKICEYAVIESARALTLDHEYDCESILTVRTDCPAGGPAKKFLARNASCGDDNVQACRCGVALQNATAKLNDILGPFDDVPPTLGVDEPAEGATVAHGFQVKGTANDETQLVSVELWIDGVFASSDNFGPSIVLDTPADLVPGAHVLEIRAKDNGDNVVTVTRNVTLAGGCATDADCEEGYLCDPASKGCLGDFGAACQSSTDCSTPLCTAFEDGKVCSAVCEGAGAATCPAGTACVADEAGGLDKCLPASPGGCGCRSGGRGEGLSAGLAALVAFGLVLVLRRRR